MQFFLNESFAPGLSPNYTPLLVSHVSLLTYVFGFVSSTMNIGCSAQISLLAENSPAQRLKVTIVKDKHNHLTTPEFAALYPENRRLDADTIVEADAMISCRGKPMDIRSHLMNTTNRAITSKDFSNLQ